MEWSEMFTREHEPSESQIRDFVSTPLWDDLDSYLRHEYNVKPKVSYSSCSMDKGMWKGWNVKYKKNGKPLCTLYPKQGHILSLVPVGLQDIGQAELMMPTFTEYTQNLLKQSVTGHNGKSLAIVVENEAVLQDMKNIISLRAVKQ